LEQLLAWFSGAALAAKVPPNQSLKLTEITACFFAARHEFTKRKNKTQ
jgi:hypothetical protein